MRGGPGVEHAVLVVLERGDQAHVVGQNEEGSWLWIVLPDGREGWLSAAYVEPIEEVASGPAATTAPLPTGAPTRPSDYPVMPGDLVEARVVRVVDGDTVVIQSGGSEMTLRLIGLDTPESVDPRRPVECFGREASARARALLEGQRVFLESDPSQGERDRYDRLLRFLWLPDGRLFNLEMIAEGYATEYTYSVPSRYQDSFRAAQRAAREAGRGLWSPESCAGVSGPSPAPPVREGCDAAYPDVCIPPSPPDLDCADVPYRRFTVLPPDPHRFDSDGNGLGCER